jgi:hypothetical protein
MNRINPLHVIVLLVVMLMFFIHKLNSAKNEFAQIKEQHRETLRFTTKLSALNEIYFDKNKIKKSIDSILKQSSLKSANISQKTTNLSIVLTSESINKTALNSLMGNFLNGSYNIDSFHIKSIDSNSASFKMEIKW